MTEPDRRVQPDAESMPPVPVRAPAEEEGALAAEPLPEPAPGYARVVSLVLPGMGHILAGAWARGAPILFGWALLLAIAFLAGGRIAEIPGQGAWDDYLALATLAVTLAGLWWLAQRDLRRRGRPVEGGDSQWRIAGRVLRSDRLAMAGLAVIVVLYLVALLAPLIAPYDPIAQQDI